MELQVDVTEHTRHLLVYEYNRGSSAAQAARNISDVYGKNFIAERTARKWFARFNSGNFDLRDSPRSGRPVELNAEHLETLLRKEKCHTTRELAKKLGCSPQTVLNHVNSLRKLSRNTSCDENDPSVTNKET